MVSPRCPVPYAQRPTWYRRSREGSGVVGLTLSAAEPLALSFTSPASAYCWLTGPPPLGAPAAHLLIQGPDAELAARRILKAAGEAVEVTRGDIGRALKLAKLPGGPLIVDVPLDWPRLHRLGVWVKDARRRLIFVSSSDPIPLHFFGPLVILTCS